MDNICHTLVGAACGAAGLSRRTRFGAATLMISANLPDIDVLVYATDTPWIEFRRGWTHGILAQVVLPVAWTASLWLFDRYKRSPGSDEEHRFHAGWTLVLALVGIYVRSQDVADAPALVFARRRSYGVWPSSPPCGRW